MELRRIEAGLGERRFYRVELSSAESSTPPTLIARVEPDASPGPPIDTPFTWRPEPGLEPIRSLLEESGLPVPASYVHDPDAGIDLLEDVGTKTLLDASAERLADRYLEACGLIPRLQRVIGSATTAPAFDRRLDARLIQTKAAKFIHWCWPGLLGREASPAERETIEAGFAAIAERLATAPFRLSHRDFKAENLHLVVRKDGSERLVMIDVQGAFMAPPEYDLVCLLRDLQVSLDESLVKRAVEVTLPRLPDSSTPEEAAIRFEAISVVRLAKDLAHVVDAGVSRGDRRRWHEIPRGLELLGGAAERLGSHIPALRALTFVIHTLTQGVRSSDIEAIGQER